MKLSETPSQILDHEEIVGLDPKDDKAVPGASMVESFATRFIENCVKLQNVNFGDHIFGFEEIRQLYQKDANKTKQNNNLEKAQWLFPLILL